MKRTDIGLILSIAISSSVAVNVYAQGTHDVDNTAVNSRDRTGSRPTAQNQSNDKLNVDISAKLRRKIVAYKGLSTDAQNVKIINQKGFVTLRGPVDNLREKEIIGKLAKQCCGESYKNELEVKQQK